MKKNNNTGLHTFWRFLSGARAYYLIGMLCACFATMAEMLRPKIIQFTIDGVLDDETKNIPVWIVELADSMGGRPSLLERLWIPAFILILCSLCAVFLRYIYQMCSAKGSERLVKNMRDRLFAHIERLSLQWHMEHQTGDVIQRCTDDVEEIKMFLSEHLINFLSTFLTIILALWFMFRIHLGMALCALAAVPVMIAVSFWFHQAISKAFRACDENESVLSTIAQENFTGVRVVRAFGREARERDRFAKQSAHVTDKWVKLGVFMCIYFSFLDFFTLGLICTNLCIGTVACVNKVLTVGELLAMMTYLTMLIRPVRQMGRILSEMSKTTVSLHRLQEILEAPVEQDVEGALKPALTGDIRFEHVNFAYPGSPQLLKDIDFCVKGGSTLGILGSTGSGKSTIAQLLCRLYPVEEGMGRITIGGMDIRQMEAHYLRTHVGYILQEPFLFSRSIGENIGITEETIDMERIHASAEAACLRHVVDTFPKGFDTFVGERGVTLSGGQKQRTAIARALNMHTPILIFDDSLSAVDTETDAAIRENLKTYMKDTTVILISHRISTLKDADQILVLEDGRITDLGTHEALKARPGFYQTICRIQEGGEKQYAE